MLAKDRVLNAIKGHAEEIGAYGVKRVGVFGSFARASQTSESDVDVLVEFKRGAKTFDNYMELKYFLERMLRRKVDLVIKEALKRRIKSRVLAEVRYA